MSITVLPGVENRNVGVRLTNDHWKPIAHHLLCNRAFLRRGDAKMLARDTRVGQTLILCGMGPSLAAHAAAVLAAHPSADVWGANRAAVWLSEHGRVAAGIGIGMEPAMRAEWEGARARLPFFLASHTHPEVVAWLVAARHPIRFFHSIVVDIPREQALWKKHFPPGIHVGIGTNVVTRAIALAVALGYAKILVLGADCALQGDVLYADGRTHAQVYDDPIVLRGTVDGRVWTARTDMVLNAIDLVRISRMREMAGGRLQVIGDTLPGALWDKDEPFLASLPQLDTHQRVTGFQVFQPVPLR